MSKMEIRLAGSGGQGVILATVILAEAAVLAGKSAVQSQSYGPEARGGSCKAECIVSDEEIGFTKVRKPTFLMALTQKSLDQYGRELPRDCTVLADASLEIPAELAENQVYSLPILKTAKETVGKAFTANIVAIGAINKLLNIVTEDEIRRAVMLHIPKGTEAINTKALDAGEAMIQ